MVVTVFFLTKFAESTGMGGGSRAEGDYQAESSANNLRVISEVCCL